VAEKRSRESRLRLDRIYTRQGDGGETRLASGRRVPKDSARLECCGTVDELNAFVGLASVSARELAGRDERLRRLAAVLEHVQHELFDLGSILASRPEAELPALGSFVLPGGSRLAAELHVCRAVCRRAERRAVALSRQEEVPADVCRYLNRLGDALFVWSRWANHLLGAGEILWNPNRPAP